MQSYDIPSTEGMTPEQATQALNAFRAAARGDGGHPYFTRDHPQHAEYAAYVARLDEIKAAGEVEAQRKEQDAALDGAAGLLAEAGVDSYAPLAAQIEALEKTPGFMNGELRQNDRPRHDKILAARDALYERAEAETQTTEEE